MTAAGKGRGRHAAVASAFLLGCALAAVTLYDGGRLRELSGLEPPTVEQQPGAERSATLNAGRRRLPIAAHLAAAEDAVGKRRASAETGLTKAAMGLAKASSTAVVVSTEYTKLRSATAATGATVNSLAGELTTGNQTAALKPMTPQPVTLRDRFAPLITVEEKARALRNLFELAALLEGAGVTYFVYCGTLVGAYRHHGMVPWDDDIDVIANASQRALLERTLSGWTGYRLHSAYAYTYKWYGVDGVAAGDRPFKWPYVDIFFFAENDTHLFDIEVPYGRDHVYRKSDVLPLVYRPFEGGLLRAPANAAAVLAVNYDVSQCRTAEYLHKSEDNVPGERQFATDCASLYSLYPFAFCARQEGGACVEEHLRVGGKTVGVYSTAVVSR